MSPHLLIRQPRDIFYIYIWPASTKKKEHENHVSIAFNMKASTYHLIIIHVLFIVSSFHDDNIPSMSLFNIYGSLRIGKIRRRHTSQL